VKVYTGTPASSPAAVPPSVPGGTTDQNKPPLSRNTTTADVAPARSTTETAGAQAARDTATGERSRSAQTDETKSTWFAAVQEKYRDCMARSTSTAFAVHTEDGLIVLDEAGNLAVRQEMPSDHFRTGLTDGNGRPKWMSVILNGSMHGDKLTVTTVGK
jgi:hypothetical protein